MDEHAYYNLKLLSQLEGMPHLTTRLAAAKLGVSVKLAHSLFKGLLRRGHIHVSRRDGRSLFYLLTPAGISEKVRLTYEFVEFSRQFYQEARRRSSEVCRRLMLDGVRRVAFLGCGDLAEISYLGLKEHSLQLSAVFDQLQAGGSFLGLPVQPLAEMWPKETSAAKGRFERILVTAYDQHLPGRRGYLPPGVAPDARFVWVFDHQEMVDEVSERIPRLPGA